MHPKTAVIVGSQAFISLPTRVAHTSEPLGRLFGSQAFSSFAPRVAVRSGVSLPCHEVPVSGVGRVGSVVPSSTFSRSISTAAMEDKQEKPLQPGAERTAYRDDMEENYGEAYATRAMDEGYGQAYGEAVKKYRTTDNQKEMQKGNTSADRDEKADAFAGPRGSNEYDTTQGEPVAEKEKGRHATGEAAFEHEKRKLG